MHFHRHRTGHTLCTFNRTESLLKDVKTLGLCSRARQDTALSSMSRASSTQLQRGGTADVQTRAYRLDGRATSSDSPCEESTLAFYTLYFILYSDSPCAKSTARSTGTTCTSC